MNCGDLRELLSAYADGELAGAQRDFVEEHLATCSDCRATLNEYRETGTQLSSLRLAPPALGANREVVSRIKARIARKDTVRWLRPVLVGVPVVVAVIAAMMVWQPWGGAAQNALIAKVRAATIGLQYYKVDRSFEIVQGGVTQTVQYRVSFSAPDKSQIEVTNGSVSGETIHVGSQVYTWGQQPPTPQFRISPGVTGVSVWSSASPSSEETLDQIESLADLEKLPDQTIDGVICIHYRGKPRDDSSASPEAETGLDSESEAYAALKEEFRQQDEWMHSWTMEVDIWVGKSDYLPRQEIETIHVPPFSPEDSEATMTMTTHYHDLDVPVEIEPPMDESGELLPGWTLTIDYAWLSRFALSGSDHIGVTNEDSDHPKVEFTLDVTNTSAGLVKDVRVMVSSITASGQGALQRMQAVPSRRGPIDLAPGESETFSLTWDYAGLYSKADITEIVSATVYEARYITPDGEEFIQPFPRTGLPMVPTESSSGN